MLMHQSEWGRFGQNWMDGGGSRSTFAASQSHTSGWQPVHKPTLDIFWKNGNLKPQKCVEWKCWTLSLRCSSALHRSSRCRDVSIAQTSESRQWGLLWHINPFTRLLVLQHLGMVLTTWDLMVCLILRSPTAAWHIFLKLTSVLSGYLRIFYCSCPTLSH